MQEHSSDQVLLLERQVGEAIEREADVFEHIERSEERPALIHHSELALQLRFLSRAGADEAGALDEDVPGQRLMQPDDALHQARLAASGSPEDYHDLAAMHVEGCILEQDPLTVTDAKIAHADDGRRRAPVHISSSGRQKRRRSRR